VRYYAPDDRLVLTDPTPEQLDHELRARPHSYWQSGGNAEGSLHAGPGEPMLWIKQPEPGWFFLTYSHPDAANWLVPYSGGSCEDLVRDERGGDLFLIPRACLVDTDSAVELVRFFLASRQPAPSVEWWYWHELPLPDEAIECSGGA
jgi:hypothetical protein